MYDCKTSPQTPKLDPKPMTPNGNVGQAPGRFQNIALASILAGLVVLIASSFVYSAESLTVLSIAAGGRHTCAVLSNGTIRCWGNNSDGRLGNGKITEDFGRTVQVANIHAGRQIAVGLNFSCASLANGTVHCWGAINTVNSAMEQPTKR